MLNPSFFRCLTRRPIRNVNSPTQSLVPMAGRYSLAAVLVLTLSTKEGHLLLVKVRFPPPSGLSIQTLSHNPHSQAPFD